MRFTFGLVLIVGLAAMLGGSSRRGAAANRRKLNNAPANG